MVEGNKRSRSLRRVYKRTPGGKTKVVYTKRKPSKPKCALCGRVLSGVPAKRPSKMSRLAKTHKRPSRPYGGVLCSECMRRKIVEEARK